MKSDEVRCYALRGEWPQIDFLDTPLREVSKKQLSAIFDHAREKGIPPDKSNLLKFIERHLFDEERGFYIPLSTSLFVERKLPDAAAITNTRSNLKSALSAIFFTNALRLPDGYGNSGFRDADASKPIIRVANCGLLIITIEYDCLSLDQFEQNLEWTRGKAGDFNKSAIAEIDRTLSRYQDYRGFSIVYSGNKSVHFHFIFSIEHLENCPVDPVVASPESNLMRSKLIGEAHNFYWDHVEGLFRTILNPEIEADRKLRAVTQYRRTPWGLRKLEKASLILGLEAGTLVPQLVIHENIRSRAIANAQSFLLPSGFSLLYPVVPRTRKHGASKGIVSPPIMEQLAAMCTQAWGPYPEPVSMQHKDGEWIIHFKNHPDDRTPSTVARGHYNRLFLQGKHSFDADFFLPDDMSADELGDFLQLGLKAVAEPAPQDEPVSGENSLPITAWERLKRNSGHTPGKFVESVFVRDFSLPITNDMKSLEGGYREKLGQILGQATGFKCPLLVKSVEGIGKTTSLSNLLALEAFDTALQRQDDTERFVALSFRTKDQALQRSVDIREKGRSAAFLLPFWDHLRLACQEVDEPKISRDMFDSLALDEVLKHLKSEKPIVYEALERRRKGLWLDARFDGGTTTLLMTHKGAEHWAENQTMRAWHHPGFQSDNDHQQNADLSKRFQITDIVFDDPEADEFVHVLDEGTFLLVAKHRVLKPNWKNQGHNKCQDYFNTFVSKQQAASKLDYEAFNSLMRLDLKRFSHFTVDFEKMPYGKDNGDKGIYRPQQGRTYHIAAKPWLLTMTARPIFLTTETFVSDVIERAYKELGLTLLRLSLVRLDGLYPLSVPIVFDKRARTDRSTEDAEFVSSLVEEIIKDDPQSLIIADGIKGKSEGVLKPSNVLTFQAMKGRNDFAERNVYIVVGWMAPEKYAQLNVLGQWLGNENVLSDYLNDNINQAAGRNQGFRKTGEDFKTTVICSPLFYSKTLAKSDQLNPRTKLHKTRKDWRAA